MSANTHTYIHIYMHAHINTWSCIYVWHKVSFLSEQNKFISNTGFCQVTYSGFLRCEGKCSSYQQVGIVLENFILNKFILYLSKLLLIYFPFFIFPFSLTPEEARVGDLGKACVRNKFALFTEKTDLVSHIYSINRMRNLHTVNDHSCFPTHIFNNIYIERPVHVSLHKYIHT